MKDFVAIIFVLLCFSSWCSANNASHGQHHEGNNHGIPTDLPTIPPGIENGVEEAWNKSLQNLTGLLFESCNISSCNPVHYKHCYEDKVPQLIVHGIALIIGILFAYFGYRLFKYTLFTIGALTGGVVAFYITYNYLNNEDHIFYISLGVAVAFGVICGVLVVILYYIGIFLAGAALGGIATWFVLSLISVDYLQEHRWIPILILVIVAVIFGIIALFVQKWFVMLATPVIGGLLVTVGIDYFLELGRMMQYAFNVMTHIPDKPDCWYSWAMLGVFGVVIVSGIIVQVFITGRKYDHRKDTKGWFCFGLCRNRKAKDSDKMEMKPLYGKYSKFDEE